MKGDIKISKKSALVIAGALSLFAMADFVSLVDTKSAGGIVIEKETMTVGSVVFRMDSVNPSTIYGGDWKLLDEDATIIFGNGSKQTGVSVGENHPIITLPEHSHTRGTMEITGSARLNSEKFDSTASGAFTKTTVSGARNEGRGGNNVNQLNFTASKSWTGATSVAGVKNPRLDVRGKRVAINVWQRIN